MGWGLILTRSLGCYILYLIVFFWREDFIWRFQTFLLIIFWQGFLGTAHSFGGVCGEQKCSHCFKSNFSSGNMGGGIIFIRFNYLYTYNTVSGCLRASLSPARHQDMCIPLCASQRWEAGQKVICMKTSKSSYELVVAWENFLISCIRNQHTSSPRYIRLESLCNPAKSHALLLHPVDTDPIGCLVWTGLSTPLLELTSQECLCLGCVFGLETQIPPLLPWQTFKFLVSLVG